MFLSEVRMKTSFSRAALGAVAAVALLPAVAAAAPTYNKDVAPILYGKCASCHRPGEVAGMSLMTYKDARPWARAIRSKVAKREMPPWSADPRFGKFRNDLSLSQAQIDTIVAWVDAGAPEGEGTAPAPPTFNTDGWKLVNGRGPDAVLEMPMEFEIPAEGQVPNFLIWDKNPFNEDKFIEAIQIRPSNYAVTHHSALYGRPLPEGTTLKKGIGWKNGPDLSYIPTYPDGSITNVVLGGPERASGDNQNKPGDRIPKFADNALARSAFQADLEDGDNRLLFYLPGGGFQAFPEGVAKRISVANELMWELHYSPSGKPETDRERFGLWFVPTPKHEVIVQRNGSGQHIVQQVELGPAAGPRPEATNAAAGSSPAASNTAPAVGSVGGGSPGGSRIPIIPPGAQNWKITAIQTFNEDVTLYNMQPHMHLRGTDMTYIATFPDGREEVVLSVPKYDFNWQHEYELATPLRLPAGSTLKTVGHYDNSINNKMNPQPDKPVFWSEQTWDEMFNGFIEITYDHRTVRPATKRGAATQNQH